MSDSTISGWRVEIWKSGMRNKAFEDFAADEFTMAMKWAENAQLRHGFEHVAIEPIRGGN